MANFVQSPNDARKGRRPLGDDIITQAKAHCREVKLCEALFGPEESQPSTKASFMRRRRRIERRASLASRQCRISGLLCRPDRMRVPHLECPGRLQKEVAFVELQSSDRNAEWSRMVQRALEDAKGDAERAALAEGLRGDVCTAMRCPHANYVVQKFVTIMPPQSLLFVRDEIRTDLRSSERHVIRTLAGSYNVCWSSGRNDTFAASWKTCLPTPHACPCIASAITSCSGWRSAPRTTTVRA